MVRDIKRRVTLGWAIVLLGSPVHGGTRAASEVITISSLQQLAEYAGASRNHVRMNPGIYRMTDYISPEDISRMKEEGRYQFIDFTGSGNVFDLRGVTIEFDTALRTELNAPRAAEFQMSGDNNTLKGLTIINTGEGFASKGGGQVFHVGGENNLFSDLTLVVRGSAPYGYGDLLGKGVSAIVSLSKRSGLRITGSNNRFVGCKIFMRAFGHAFFIQEGADNTYFENCYAEGELRSTDEMLAETSGPAYENDFRSDYPNRDGEKKITPGYMKSLAECGFRTYDAGKVTLMNCTSKGMRIGFAFRDVPAHMENCVALENERGFWVGSGAVVKNSRGDAKYGPLLFVERDNNVVELELLPGESEMTVHALAVMTGTDSRISISPSGEENDARRLPIMLGFVPPEHGENMSPIKEYPEDWTNSGPPTRLQLLNQTVMPVIVSAQARDSEVGSKGEVARE
jgi:hypothetical protein